MTAAAPAALVVPPEPERARRELRRAAGSDPDRARREIDRRLTNLLWRSWAEPLRRHGARRALLAEQVSAIRTESWLWVMGDRSWAAVAESVAGRVVRRL